MYWCVGYYMVGLACFAAQVGHRGAYWAKTLKRCFNNYSQGAEYQLWSMRCEWMLMVVF